MNENGKTLIFAGAAVVLAIVAAVSAPSYEDPESFSDQGELFYPDFTDPLKAVALEVFEYDEAAASGRTFKVERKGDTWVIPSHHDYPADAKERLSKTAGAVIGLARDSIRSDSKDLHKDFGVIDPRDESPGSEGRGRRVRLLDAKGNALADYIFGKKIDEEARYVRLPGQNRVYGVKTKAEITTKFEDWIETDLLDLSAWDIRGLTLDLYAIDEEGGGIKSGDLLKLSREESSATAWKMEGIKAEEELNTDKVSDMTSALDDLKIAGVRPKPAFLKENIKAKGDVVIPDRLTPQQLLSIQSLQTQGYFLVQEKREGKVVGLRIASNEGDLSVSCSNGIVYTLRFGEIVPGSGEAVTAGAGKEKKESGEKKEGEGTHRYLFVTAKFDKGLLEPLPEDPGEYKEDPGKSEEDRKKAEEEHKKKKREYDDKKRDHDQKVKEGEKRAKELTDRFAAWYYVISADLFKKLHLSRKDLVKPKKKEEEKGHEGHDHKPGEPHEESGEKKPDGEKPAGEDKPEQEKPAEEAKPEETPEKP